MAEVGPEAEQHREALQLLSINLERRWEAIVMQALQWQNRLKRELGEKQVLGSSLEPGLVDLRQISPVPAGPAPPPPDDSWEWDETDMTITELEPPRGAPDLSSEPSDSFPSDGNQPAGIRTGVPAGPETTSHTGAGSCGISRTIPPSNNTIYQVYSLHSVELYRQPPFPLASVSSLHKSTAGTRKQLLLKSLSKDSSFSSIESLPDLVGGLTSYVEPGRTAGCRDGESESGRGSGQSASESGIVSDTGDTETTTTREEEEEDKNQRKFEGTRVAPHKGDVTKCSQRTKKEEGVKEKGKRREESRRNREEEKRRRHRRGGGEAVEILINGRGILNPADSDSDFEVGGVTGADSPRPFAKFAGDPSASSGSSQGSSLESLLALGLELFPSKDHLQRSASLESCLAPCRSGGGETGGGGSLASLEDLDPGRSRDPDGGDDEPGEDAESGARGEPSSGELSRRTLDLLRRLENIQSPMAAAAMTRSVSDMTLRSGFPQRSRIPASPSLGGRLSGILGPSRRGPPSLINESSATASLTELSSAEDSSLGSEDFATLRNQRRRRLFPDPAGAPNGNCGKRCHHGSGRGGHGMDEADAASLSLLVNVSCTSACTDEDEDDSDLLSSSTLTLTEEELGVRDGEDEDGEKLSGASSGHDDDDDEDMEGSYVLGLEYMKRELQSWIRPPRASSSSSSSKTEAVLQDELQCGTFAASPQSNEQLCFQSRAKLIEANGNDKTRRNEKEQEAENRRNATRSYISQFVDDVENGNVEQGGSRGKDEDDEFLREEASVFTKKGDPPRESYAFAKAAESAQDVVGVSIAKTESGSAKKPLSSSPSRELLPFPSKRASSLVGQLRGELPCHSASLPSPPSLSPVEDCRSHDALRGGVGGGRKAITSQEKFKFSSFVTEETRREVRDKESSLPPKKRHNSHPSCCGRLPSSPTSPSSLHPRRVDKKENVHDFVREIIDMTSHALRSKENDEPSQTDFLPDQSPASLAQIRDKVLEHSHRPLQLRKGDFYSYLSLSSHDSDCGEVSQCSEDRSSSPVYGDPDPDRDLDLDREDEDVFRAPDLKSSSSPPLSPDIRDEETLFAACTEEVYLGPPLCYSMELTKKPRRRPQEEGPDYELDNGFDYLPGDSLTYLSPSEEFVPPRDQGHLYFQASSPISSSPFLDPCYTSLSTSTSSSPFLDPCYTSLSTSTSSSPFLDPCHRSPSLRGPGSKPNADTPSSPLPHPPPPLPVSSGVEEERRGEDPRLLCDVAGGEVAAAASVGAPREERSRNEGPPYLNPRARVAPIDSSAAECLADTKTLESNMGAVMTKISVCGSATNPSKEPAAAATRINPKINCSAMREADREERGRRGRSGSQQEAKAAAQKQSAVGRAARNAQTSVRAAASRTKTARRLPVLGTGTSRIQL